MKTLKNKKHWELWEMAQKVIYLNIAIGNDSLELEKLTLDFLSTKKNSHLSRSYKKADLIDIITRYTQELDKSI